MAQRKKTMAAEDAASMINDLLSGRKFDSVDAVVEAHPHLEIGRKLFEKSNPSAPATVVNTGDGPPLMRRIGAR